MLPLGMVRDSGLDRTYHHVMPCPLTVLKILHQIVCNLSIPPPHAIPSSEPPRVRSSGVKSRCQHKVVPHIFPLWHLPAT